MIILIEFNFYAVKLYNSFGCHHDWTLFFVLCFYRFLFDFTKFDYDFASSKIFYVKFQSILQIKILGNHIDEEQLARKYRDT